MINVVLVDCTAEVLRLYSDANHWLAVIPRFLYVSPLSNTFPRRTEFVRHLLAGSPIIILRRSEIPAQFALINRPLPHTNPRAAGLPAKDYEPHLARSFHITSH